MLDNFQEPFSFEERDQIFQLYRCEREGRLCWCQLLLEMCFLFKQIIVKKTFQA